MSKYILESGAYRGCTQPFEGFTIGSTELCGPDGKIVNGSEVVIFGDNNKPLSVDDYRQFDVSGEGKKGFTVYTNVEGVNTFTPTLGENGSLSETDTTGRDWVIGEKGTNIVEPENKVDFIAKGKFIINETYSGATNVELGENEIPKVGDKVVLYKDGKVADLSTIKELLNDEGEDVAFGFVPVDKVGGKNTIVFKMGDVGNSVLIAGATDGTEIDLTLNELHVDRETGFISMIPSIDVGSQIDARMTDVKNNPVEYRCFGAIVVLGLAVVARVLQVDNNRQRQKKIARQERQDAAEFLEGQKSGLINNISQALGGIQSEVQKPVGINMSSKVQVPVSNLPFSGSTAVYVDGGLVGHTTDRGLSHSVNNPSYHPEFSINVVQDIKRGRVDDARRAKQGLIDDLKNSKLFSEHEKSSWLERLFGIKPDNY